MNEVNNEAPIDSFFRPKSWQDAVQTWSKGGILASVELGGIGPGYEQAIQILVFEILGSWSGKGPVVTGGNYSPEYQAHFQTTAKRLNKVYEFSGAQCGAAKSLAASFINHGYRETLDEAGPDRLIMVSGKFPTPMNSDTHLWVDKSEFKTLKEKACKYDDLCK